MELGKLLGRLSGQKPIFSSTADLKTSLQAIIELETGSTVENVIRKRGIKTPSLIATEPSGQKTGIELLYKTDRLKTNVNGEEYDLKRHSAHDLARYDFWRKVQTIEELVFSSARALDCGYAVLLSNDAQYWTSGRKENPIDREFRLDEGRTVRTSILGWEGNPAQGSIVGREQSLIIASSYDLRWCDYSTAGGANFRYLLLKIAPYPIALQLNDSGLLNSASDSTSVENERRKQLTEITIRQGQGRFRVELLAAYERRCAISGYQADEALEAAHIVPYNGPHTNAVSNGLLLRADLHTLFDQGLIAIDTMAMSVLISPKLQPSQYAAFRGIALRLPSNPKHHPSIEALDKHRRTTEL